MKKLSLKDFKKVLKREEMREMSGGRYATYFACHSASYSEGPGYQCYWNGGGWILSHP
ncbi:hypothetical protein [Flavobacterium sp.]|uniref:hypothetical protein n=1 Tax=Flavobacterium sp. TaxID=239 RepID=UPI00286AAAF8|nr:hypothetical protein [Flavobacterium sp.]